MADALGARRNGGIQRHFLVLHDSPYQMDAMLADLQGNIWVRTSQFGLFKWNGSSWQNWPTVGGPITMTGLGKDLDGVVCVSTWYGGVYKMISDNPVFFVDADNIPRNVIARPDGDIWINNYGGNGTLGTVRHYTCLRTVIEAHEHVQ